MRWLILLIVFPLVLIADKYNYSYHKNGLPTVRVEVSSGKVEIYSNIHIEKLTKKILHNIHAKHYKDLAYKIYLKKLKVKYPSLEFKVLKDYRWIEHNKYLNIKTLREFSVNIK